MSIRTKAILTLAACLAALVGVSALLLHLVISPKFRELELLDTHNSVDRVVKELEDNTARLASTAADWGRWDDAWFFVQGKNPAFPAQNLDLESLANLNVELILFLDESGVLREGREVELEKRTIREVDGSSVAPLVKLVQSMPGGLTRAKSGFSAIGERPLLFGGQPIVRNDGSGPVAGYLLFAVFLDSSFVEKISYKLNHKVSISPYGDWVVAEKARRGSSTLFDDVTIVTSPLDGRTIEGMTVVADSTGNPVFTVVVELRRSINLIGEAALFNGVSALVTLGALFTLLVVLLIDRTVLSRLARMTVALGSDPGGKVEFGEPGNDEIGVLARAFEESYQALALISDNTRRSERQKEMALAGGDLGFWEYNVQTGRVFFSERFMTMLGYGHFAMPHTLETLKGLVHEEDRPLFAACVDEAVAGTGAGWEAEYRVRRSDGGYAYVYSRGKVVDTTPAGRPQLLYGTHMDVTERVVERLHKKKLKEQLATAQKMKAIATLAGGVAHNFNNILAVIIGYTELVMDDLEKGGQTWTNAREVIVASSRAADLVRQLLIFSKDREQTIEKVDIRRLVYESFRFMREVIPTSIEMILTMPEESALVSCDTFMMRQAFINICTNAMEAMEGEQGKVIITVSYQPGRDEGGDRGDRVRIIFSDDGEGMDEATLASAFDPYFTTRDAAEKSGLGLSLVHGAVTGCGGEIEIKSSVGVGTTVLVTLPAEVGVEASAQERPASLAGSERILFIDDEKLLVDIASQYFGRLGYPITSMDSASDGLAVFLADPKAWDVVITDMTMPGLNGVELAARVRQASPGLPIFLCSGYIDVVSEEERKKAGIVKVFKKPVSFDALAGAIREHYDAR